jgi:FeS assembly SUF system protein
MLTEEDVVGAIKQVYDPEIPVNIYDLGLVYKVDIQDQKVNVKMSLTSESCPSAQQIPEMVKTRISALPYVKDVDVEIVWEPKWNPAMISPEGKKILKLEDES